MKKVALEAAIITEHPNGYASLALNNDLLAGLTEVEQQAFLKSLLVMARNKLARDISFASREQKISISIDEVHTPHVLQLKLLVTPAGDFNLLTYFGGAADEETPLRSGLHHAVEVLGAVEAETFK